MVYPKGNYHVDFCKLNQQELGMQLSKIVELLSKARGVKAVALGGSQSREEADEHSDFDIV